MEDVPALPPAVTLSPPALAARRTIRLREVARSWSGRALLVGGPVMVVFMILTATNAGGQVTLWENAHWTAAALLAAVLGALGALRAEDHERLQRRLVFACTVLWLAGQIAWDVQFAMAFYDIPAPSDIGYLGAMVPAFLALALLVRSRGTLAEEAAVYLDSASIFLSITAVVIALTDRTGLPAEVSVFVLVYPILHLATAGGGLMALLAIGAEPRPRGAYLVLAGVALLGLSWVDWLREAVVALPAAGSLAGFAFSIGIVAVGAGGATWRSRREAGATYRQFASVALWLLPAGAVATSLALLLLRTIAGHAAGVAEGAASAAIAIAVLRQALLLRERNALLRQQRSANEQLGLALAKRAESDALFQALVENVPAAVYLDEHDPTVTDGGRLAYVSPAIAGIIGFDPHELLNDPELFPSRVHPADADRVLAALAEHWRTGQPLETEYRMLARDGTIVWVSDQARLVIRADGTRVGQGVLVDTSDRKRLEAQLVHDARHDPLTGLANRTLVSERLAARLTSRRRRSQVAVLFLDMDDFKVVNDTLGHEVGDALLIEVARRLRGEIRPTDVAGRLGGDEFTLLVGGIERPDDAIVVADRILASLRRPVDIEGRRLVVSASIGITIATPGGGAAVDDLLAEADMALYEAKARGKGRHALFDPAMREKAWARLDLEGELRAAIDRREFEVHYQPIIELPFRRLVGVEALVRWRHPVRGLVAPDAFVPVAEATGLIVPIGELVLREACRQAREWQLRHPAHEHLGMAVNLSTRQTREPGLPNLVRRILDETGLAAPDLTLEVTETLLLDTAVADASIRELRQLGVALAIDDFGTGFAGLEYVKRLAVSGLKVDRSFVAGLGRSSADTGIVTATVALARGLGLVVTAEGVETQEQLSHLEALGCDRAQGFLFSPPVPAADIERLLAGVGADWKAA